MLDCTRRAIRKYSKEKGKRITIAFFPPDYDLYNYVKNQGMPTSAFIKNLIREKKNG